LLLSCEAGGAKSSLIAAAISLASAYLSGKTLIPETLEREVSRAVMISAMRRTSDWVAVSTRAFPLSLALNSA